MRRFRFIRIGGASSTLIDNLVYNLSAKQGGFDFVYTRDAIPYPKGLDRSVPADPDKLLKLLVRFMERRDHLEHPIGVCDCHLEDDILTHGTQSAAVMTTYDAQRRFAPSPPVKGLCFALVDLLFEAMGIITPCHYESRSCPMDFWPGSREALRSGIEAGAFCSGCRGILLRGLGQGKMSLAELAAAYKMLDYVAGRKRCFVLMPFRADLLSLYETCIKPTAEAAGWSCSRADEIYETRQVMDVVCEQILCADLVLADLTGKNANVFYELGYAHASDKNTILLAQSLEDVPFDLRHRQVIPYRDSKSGRQKLAQSIAKYLWRPKTTAAEAL